jgi:hypothetical protein
MPASIIKTFAEKTGKTELEVEKKWDEAKFIVKKKIPETDKRYYPTVVSILKKMLFINEDATSTGDIAVVPKRLGEKPFKQASLQYDGNLSGYPYFNIKEVGDYMKVAGSKRMNQKIQHSDERINRHLKENGGPFLLKFGNNTIKLTKKDF